MDRRTQASPVAIQDVTDQDAATKAFVDSDIDTVFPKMIVSRRKLVEFYQEHAPQKVKDVDRILQAYSAEELVTTLKKKYGEAPPTIEWEESIVTAKQLYDFFMVYDYSRAHAVEQRATCLLLKNGLAAQSSDNLLGIASELETPSAIGPSVVFVVRRFRM